LIFIWGGCGKYPNPDTVANETVVALRCENVVSNGRLLYRVTEIWKDESNGRFTLKVNDIIDPQYPLDGNENVGQESLLLHDGRNENFKRFPDAMNIHNGRVSALGDIPVNKLKEKFIRERERKE